MSIERITDLCRAFAAARQDVAQEVATVQALIDAIKAKYAPEIATRTAAMAAVYDELHAVIEAEPALFAKRKTLVLFGIKVGFVKGRGRMIWKKSEQVVAAIKRLLPEQQAVLIQTKEVPVKAALNALPAADLRRIGVTIEDAGDQVVIAPQDGDLDKMVAALLGDPATGDDAAPSEEAA
ncbi:conserved hypothetical protein [uncultured Alphaproteobacteria bacterium]|uniref:Uncharacterized protein n=1 Tax=uncultured Alphaproteobacteria bacterium TaxID=91750 RepID=A0A212KJZ5_9PROT|nr:conserved hypothetical protein [uncultured Alphaproteobacteria bacterium]